MTGRGATWHRGLDRFGFTLAGAGPGEVGQYVNGSLAPVRPSLAISTSGLATPGLSDSISLAISSRPRGWVGVPVGGDQPLVDAPGGLDLDVLIVANDEGTVSVLLVGTIAAGIPTLAEEHPHCAAILGKDGVRPSRV